MKKLVAVLIIAAMIVAIRFVWFIPPAEEAMEAEPVTDVAVRVGEVTRTTLRDYVTAYGVVAPEPAGKGPAASARVAPSVAGVIVAASCVEGQHVTRGDLLFQLDSRAADVAVDFASNAVDRERQLLSIEGTSEKAVQIAELELESARVQQALLRVLAPISGTVVRVGVKPGEAVDLSTVLADIVDLDRLVASASVPSTELARLAPGQPAEITVDSAAATLKGTIDFISPQVDPLTGTAEVRVALPADAGLRPGQVVTIRIVSTEHADTLAVPIASVVSNEDGTSVIAIVEGNTATQWPVTTGIRDSDLIEVAADGLRPGMRVVTEGAYALPEETAVHVIAN
jgi:RND family efflux transporter MFP subunit